MSTPKTATIDKAHLASLLVIARDPKAMAELAKNDPEAHKSLLQVVVALAETGSPKAMANVLGFDPTATESFEDWMNLPKGASTYLGLNFKIAGKSAAFRVVAPTKILTEKAATAEKIKELSLHVGAYAVSKAKELGIEIA
jgi:hypothetical protein